MSLRERIRQLSDDGSTTKLQKAETHQRLREVVKDHTYRLSEDALQAFKLIYDIEIGKYGEDAEKLDKESRKLIKRTVPHFHTFQMNLASALDTPAMLGLLAQKYEPIVKAPWDSAPDSINEVCVEFMYEGEAARTYVHINELIPL